MKVRTVLRVLVVATILALLAAMLPQLASAAPKGASDRYLVRARSSADYAGLRAKAVQSGVRVLRDLPQLHMMVVRASTAAHSSIAADRRAAGVARDRLQRVAVDEPAGAPNLSKPGVLGGAQVRLPAAAAAKAAAAGINPDPAWDYKACSGTTAASACPRGGRPPPAARPSPSGSPTPASTSPTPSWPRRSRGLST